MLIDVTVSVFLLIMLWRGYATGAFSQVIRLFSIVLGFIVARTAAAGLAPAMDRAFSTQPPIGELVAAVILWLGTSYLVSLLLRWAFKSTVEKRMHMSNKVAGSLVGLCKGGVIAYLLLSLTAVLADPLARHVPQGIFPVKSSYLVHFVSRHNVLASWTVPALGKLESLAEVARHPRSSLTPDTQDLLRDPRIGALVQDPLLGNAIVTGDWNFALQDPRVKRIFTDPKLLNKLLQSSINLRNTSPERGER